MEIKNVKRIAFFILVLSMLLFSSCSSAPEPTPTPTQQEKTKVTATGSFNCEGECDPNELEANFYLEGGRMAGTGQLLIPDDDILFEVSFDATSYPDGTVDGWVSFESPEMYIHFKIEGKFAEGVLEATVIEDPNNSIIIPPSFTLEY